MKPDPSKSMDMRDPQYRASLTDPQSEIDDHLQEIRKICDRYELPYFIVVNHPAPSRESWTTQMASKVYNDGDSYELFSTVNSLVMRASDGMLEIAPTERLDDEFQSDDRE